MIRMRETCAEVLEGPSDGRGRPHPAWRRSCKRKPAEGSRYCWQHRQYHTHEKGEKPREH